MIARSKFIILFVLLIAASLFINLHKDISVPANRPFAEFPVHYRGWSMEAESVLDERTLKVLRPTDYFSRRYAMEGDVPVELYIGYHGGGKDSGGIHSPKHCLPGSGWYKASEENMKVSVGNKEMRLVKAVYQKGEDKELFLYWFQVKGKTLTSEYALKLSEIMSSILYRRRDSAFIRISVPFTSDEEKAAGTGMRFIREFYPVIEEFLPK